MSIDNLSDYEKGLYAVKNIPMFYLGQEVQTKDGIGIIVYLKMDWNGLYIEPHTSEAVVWYSTESAVRKAEGNGSRWVSFTYKLTELTVIDNKDT